MRRSRSVTGDRSARARDTRARLRGARGHPAVLGRCRVRVGALASRWSHRRGWRRQGGNRDDQHARGRERASLHEHNRPHLDLRNEALRNQPFLSPPGSTGAGGAADLGRVAAAAATAARSDARGRSPPAAHPPACRRISRGVRTAGCAERAGDIGSRAAPHRHARGQRRAADSQPLIASGKRVARVRAGRAWSPRRSDVSIRHPDPRAPPVPRADRGRPGRPIARGVLGPGDAPPRIVQQRRAAQRRRTIRASSRGRCRRAGRCESGSAARRDSVRGVARETNHCASARQLRRGREVPRLLPRTAGRDARTEPHELLDLPLVWWLAVAAPDPNSQRSDAPVGTNTPFAAREYGVDECRCSPTTSQRRPEQRGVPSMRSLADHRDAQRAGAPRSARRRPPPCSGRAPCAAHRCDVAQVHTGASGPATTTASSVPSSSGPAVKRAGAPEQRSTSSCATQAGAEGLPCALLLARVADGQRRAVGGVGERRTRHSGVDVGLCAAHRPPVPTHHELHREHAEHRRAGWEDSVVRRSRHGGISCRVSSIAGGQPAGPAPTTKRHFVGSEEYMASWWGPRPSPAEQRLLNCAVGRCEYAWPLTGATPSSSSSSNAFRWCGRRRRDRRPGRGWQDAAGGRGRGPREYARLLGGVGAGHALRRIDPPGSIRAAAAGRRSPGGR